VEGIIGIYEGESKEVELKFTHREADSFEMARMIDKVAILNVTCHEIYEVLLPPLDENFAKRLGLPGLRQLVEQVQMAAAREYEHTMLAKRNALLGEALLKASDFELPTALVDQEVRKVFEQQLLSKYRTPQELERAEQEFPLFDKAERDDIAKELKLRYILADVVDKEGITIPDDELDRQYQLYKQYAQSQEASRPDDFKTSMSLDDTMQKQNLKLTMLQNMAFDAVAKVSSIVVTDAPPPKKHSFYKPNEEEQYQLRRAGVGNPYASALLSG